MKKIYIITAIILGTLLFSSCEDFLTVNPSNQAPADSYVRTTDDAQVMINGILRNMTSSSYYGRNFQVQADYKGGDLVPLMMGRGSDAYYTFNQTAEASSGSGFWNQIYYCLMQVNNLLANIETLQAEGATGFDSFKGYALILRAQLHFDLVRLYGLPYNYKPESYGVPIANRVFDAYEQRTRDSVKEVYDQIVADLNAGIPLVPTGNKNNSIYFHYYGKSLLSKVYLYMDNFSGALQAAQDVINNSSYKLYTNTEWLGSWSKEFGSESIFELGMYDSEADLTTSSLGYYYLPKGYFNVAGILTASNYYLDRLGEDPDDVRWSVMLPDEKHNPDGNPPVIRLGGNCKYVGGPGITGDKGKASAVNIKVMRFSEVYLIAAEAALMSNNNALAAEYLNAIRKRSPNLAPATASTVTRRMILDERSKEFYAEGHKFFEEIRANQTIEFNDEMCEGGFSASLRGKTIDRTFYKVVWPISIAEINANPPIGEQQNPGY